MRHTTIIGENLNSTGTDTTTSALASTRNNQTIFDCTGTIHSHNQHSDTDDHTPYMNLGRREDNSFIHQNTIRTTTHIDRTPFECYDLVIRQVDHAFRSKSVLPISLRNRSNGQPGITLFRRTIQHLN